MLLEHYEELVHQHERLLIAEARLERECQVLRTENATLRTAMGETGLLLEEALERLRCHIMGRG